MLITIDFETYWDSKSGYSLKNMSAIDYIRDPRFHVQMMGVNANGKTVLFDTPQDVADAVRGLKMQYQEDQYIVGHNINGFDGLILSEIFGWRPIILDTIALMRWTGLARIMGVSLKKMTEHFGTGEKIAGTVISDGKRTKEDFTPEEWEAFRQYCTDDVNQTAACARIMYEYIGGKTIEEVVKFSNITGHMATEPVFYIDKTKVQSLLEEEHQRVLSSRAALQKYFHLEEDEDFRKALRSAKKFTSMLQSLGVEPPLKVSEAQTATKQKKHPGEIIEPVMVPALSKQDLPFLEMQNHPDERVATLVRARLENNSSVLESRLKNMLHFAEQDKPVPVMLKVFSAHTSRYGAGNSAGKTDGLQFQNLPKRDPRMLEVRKAIHVKPGYKVVAADSSQIEARIVAYIANQYDLIEAFRLGADPYSDLAQAIFHIPSEEIHHGAKTGNKEYKKYRNVAKTAVLGCFGPDTKVLTDTGWKPIVMVLVTDKLWDGEEWVQNDGPICSGRKLVTNLEGVIVTPDHLIWNGTSWNTVTEYQQGRCSLKSALNFAEKSLRTQRFFLKNKVILQEFYTGSGVKDVVQPLGTKQMRLQELRKTIAKNVWKFLEMLRTSHTSNAFIQTRNQGLSLGSLQWCDLFQDYGHHALKIKSVFVRLRALVERLAILLASTTYSTEDRRVVTPVLKEKQGRHNKNYTGNMITYAQIRNIEGVYLTEYLLVLTDVLTPTIITTQTMGAEVSQLNFLLDRIFLNISSHLKDGITQCLNWIESIIAEVMNQVIYVLLQGVKIQVIDEAMENCKHFVWPNKKKSMNYEIVYDIMNSGPRNRFTILTDSGPLLVHNCGYGVGYQTYSNALLRAGVKLSEDPEEHLRQARNAHTIYRQRNASIVALWDRCDSVIRSLIMGSDGYFGGPTGALFHYTHKRMPYVSCNVSCIELPSGYTLWYPNLRSELNDKGKMEFVYDRTDEYGKLGKYRIYGSGLVENCTQSLAFQVLMYQANRMYDAGIKLSCNIHDSWATVVPEVAAQAMADKMVAIMRTPPPWLTGCPLDAEAEITDDFTGV